MSRFPESPAGVREDFPFSSASLRQGEREEGSTARFWGVREGEGREGRREGVMGREGEGRVVEEEEERRRRWKRRRLAATTRFGGTRRGRCLCLAPEFLGRLRGRRIGE